jgi:hypothetical protein
MEDQEIQDLINTYIEAYNSFDTDKMLSVLHPDIDFKNFTNGEMDLHLQGKEAFAAQAKQAATFFSQRKQTVTEMMINSETAEVALDYFAILAVDLPNGLQAGQSLDMKGSSIFSFKNKLVIALEDRS